MCRLALGTWGGEGGLHVCIVGRMIGRFLGRRGRLGGGGRGGSCRGG